MSSVPADVTGVVAVPMLLSVSIAAEVLGCSARTVRRRIADGEIEARVDHGRIVIRGDDLRRYIDRLERLNGSAVRARARAGRAYDFLRAGGED